MRHLLIGVAALALAASGASAEPGKNNGNGGGGKPAAAMKANPGNGAGKVKGNGNTQGNGNAKVPQMKAMAGANKPAGKPDRKADKGPGFANGNKDRGADFARATRGDDREWRDRSAGGVRWSADSRPDRYQVVRGFIEGCPPGLAKKNNGCMPPGLAKKRDYRPDWWGYSGFRDGRYFYDDGYLVRLGERGRIADYIPLLGGALGIGNVWPSYYQPVSLPSYYESYYGLGPQQSYRYANDVIYRVDPETAAITSIAALLTGDDFAIGQPMPQGYDVYNVPYGSRGQYYDRPDAMYRYSDGYVYQIDPETKLVAAAIELLAS